MFLDKTNICSCKLSKADLLQPSVKVGIVQYAEGLNRKKKVEKGRINPLHLTAELKHQFPALDWDLHRWPSSIQNFTTSFPGAPALCVCMCVSADIY